MTVLIIAIYVVFAAAGLLTLWRIIVGPVSYTHLTLPTICSV